MHRTALVTLCALAFVSSPIAACAAPMPVSPAEAQAWARYLVPLPKTLTITASVEVDPAAIAIIPPPSSDVVVVQACKELRVTLGLAEDAPNPPNPAFTVTLVLGGSEADPLIPLKNSEQASKVVIEPGQNGLRLIALQPRGLYYAVKSLQQLLAPYVTPPPPPLPKGGSGGVARIPLFEMTDWPDMTDRGLWGCDHFLWLRWMADRKMNIGEQISARSVTSDRVGHSWLKDGREPMVTEGPYYGLRPVPVTLHLEQVWSSGLFDYYPEVIGVGGQYGAICYSNGAFTNVLADWICDLRSLPFVEEVDVWMAENLHGKGGCHCAQCSLWDRSVLEAETIVAAWNLAKQRLGVPIGLYILTSEQTYSSNAAVFAAIPADVKVWYYHSLYTYTCGRCPIIPNNVANLAAAGRYAGVCPSISNLSANEPFQSAEFINYRMNEFVNKGLSGLIGYAVPPPLVKFCGYNVEAEAEWSWNVNGRSTHEFAASYAVRKGLADPERFADWADAIGKLEFDLYGSDWPTCEGRSWPGYVANLLLDGHLPALGEAYPGFRGPWGEFESAQQLDDDLALAAKALALAKEMGIPEYWYESVHVDGLMTSLRALYKLKGLVVNGSVSPADRETARFYFGVYVNGLRQSIDAVQQWCLVVNGESGSVGDTVTTMQECIDGDGEDNPGMLAVASGLGCTPNLAYTGEPAATIADAKVRGAGAAVKLYGELVSGGSGSVRYLQEPDRSAGIRVSTSAYLATGTPVTLFGYVSSSNGELVINPDIIQYAGSASTIAPIGMLGERLGGGAFGAQPAVMEYRTVIEDGVAVNRLLPAMGLNNIGLLVRTAGAVTYVGGDYLYVDDGSGCDDGSGHLGLKVQCADAAWSKPAVGQFVSVTGMSSTYFDRGYTWRALYVPLETYIAVIDTGSGHTPPEITGQPADQDVCPGGTAAFTVSASGADLSYQWRKGTTDITNGGHYSNATTSRLTVSNCDSSDVAADYNCVVSNPYGSVTSSNAALTLGGIPPAPAALAASDLGVDTITWHWGSVPEAVGYTLWTAASGGTQIGGTITGTSCTETDLDPGTSYTRYVQTVGACAVSATRTPLGPASTTPRYCVQNGGFESGFTGGLGNYWIRGTGSGTISQSTSIKHSGASSQKFVDPVGGDAFTSWIYQKLNVQAGRNYTYKVWNRREVTGGCVVALGYNATGGIDPDAVYQTLGAGGGVWSLKSVSVASGATGLVTIMVCAGQNHSDTTAYIDDISLLPQAPTTSGGSATISPGGSATITASGGFGGASSELHWYTGAAGTGTHAGTGTSLVVSPTVTTTYYPRWEPAYAGGGCCVSDDGPSVTVTVTP